MATELEAAGEVAVSSGGASPGPWAAILRCHHTNTALRGHWAECISHSDHCGQNITRTYITSFHLSGQLQLPRLDSAKLIVINSLSSSLF